MSPDDPDVTVAGLRGLALQRKQAERRRLHREAVAGMPKVRRGIPHDEDQTNPAHTPEQCRELRRMLILCGTLKPAKD